MGQTWINESACIPRNGKKLQTITVILLHLSDLIQTVTLESLGRHKFSIIPNHRHGFDGLFKIDASRGIKTNCTLCVCLSKKWKCYQFALKEAMVVEMGEAGTESKSLWSSSIPWPLRVHPTPSSRQHAISSTLVMMQEQAWMPISLLPSSPLPFLVSLFPLSTTHPPP